MIHFVSTNRSSANQIIFDLCLQGSSLNYEMPKAIRKYLSVFVSANRSDVLISCRFEPAYGSVLFEPNKEIKLRVINVFLTGKFY
jgi:hypothetical protein